MTYVFIAIAAIVLGVILWVLIHSGWRFARPLNRHYFERKWLELLARVKTHDGMILSVIDADKLLDEALKRRGYKGRTMGERLVAAQRVLSNNDGVWFAHKLRSRLVHEPEVRLKKSEAKDALAAIKQSLIDL